MIDAAVVAGAVLVLAALFTTACRALLAHLAARRLEAAQEQGAAPSFMDWDADAELGQLVPFERRPPAGVVSIPADLMDRDGLGSA